MLTRFKEKYIGDAAFYKRYLYLALPMILQNAKMCIRDRLLIDRGLDQKTRNLYEVLNVQKIT